MKRLTFLALFLLILVSPIIFFLNEKGAISIGHSYEEDYADIVLTLDEKMYEDATQLLKVFLRRYGEDPLAFNNLAVIQVRLGLFDEADANFASAEKNAEGVMVPRSVSIHALENKNGDLEIFQMAHSAAQGAAFFGETPVETVDIARLVKSNIKNAGN